MTTAFDVAEHILSRLGPIRGLKLQKLVYYAQAWHLVWRGRPLFEDKIEGWINGPVVREVWERHQNLASVETVGGDERALDSGQLEVIDQVLALYGPKPSEYLSSLTHDESPWIKARRGLLPDERGSTVIEHEWMTSFYENEPPGGRGMELHVSADELQEIMAGQMELLRGEYVTLEDLKRELRRPAG